MRDSPESSAHWPLFLHLPCCLPSSSMTPVLGLCLLWAASSTVSLTPHLCWGPHDPDLQTHMLGFSCLVWLSVSSLSLKSPETSKHNSVSSSPNLPHLLYFRIFVFLVKKHAICRKTNKNPKSKIIKPEKKSGKQKGNFWKKKKEERKLEKSVCSISNVGYNPFWKSIHFTEIRFSTRIQVWKPFQRGTSPLSFLSGRYWTAEERKLSRSAHVTGISECSLLLLPASHKSVNTQARGTGT